MSSQLRIRRALLSAWRKDGLVDFGRLLEKLGVEILSTGGSARTLREAGIAVRDVADLTGFPEMMNGRVKTLHPRVHGGLLFRRDVEEHVAAAEEHGIPPIDLVYVDLYPFEAALRSGSPSDAEAIELIDIGGPAMIRSAAKNHAHVAVVTSQEDLAGVQEELEAKDGATELPFRRRLAARAFQRTSAYDAAIGGYLDEDGFPEELVVAARLGAVTRYGENPHQAGAVYRVGQGGVAAARQLLGKELSYNNYLDASAAWEAVKGFEDPAAVVVKHRNPCGAAVAADPKKAFERALAGDPLSAFGGIIAINRPLDRELAEVIANPKCFFEVLLAPAVEDGIPELFVEKVRWGKNLRILQVDPSSEQLQIRSIDGGLLAQEPDEAGAYEMKVVTKRAPSEDELRDLRFAWEVCRHAVSNAIVFARNGELVGLGAGQPSRVDSVESAARKAGDKAKGAVMASDAFFPFPDGVEAAAQAGVTAVIQPGGSIRDEKIVAACDERGVAMVLTGRRHFRH